MNKKKLLAGISIVLWDIGMLGVVAPSWISAADNVLLDYGICLVLGTFGLTAAVVHYITSE